MLAKLSEANILPTYRFVDTSQPTQVQTGMLYPCENTMRPGVDSGMEMVSVLSFDLANGLTPGESTAVMAAGSTVYANSNSMYLATRPTMNFIPGLGIAVSPDVEAVGQARQTPLPNGEANDPGRVTYIHKFDLNTPTRAEYRASGQVDGELLNQFAMSEHENILRVGATRYRKGAWEPTDSFVATLQERGNQLVELGRVGELGKTEKIRSIRFMGKMAYVVTFRQTDPLYTVDLSVPQTPVVLGELKIEGFSAYLHPLAPGYLLGVGRDADHEGRIKGMQLSIFDVRDPRNPQRVHNYTVKDASTLVEWDHRAFLYWPATQSLALPVQAWSSETNGAPPEHFMGVYLMSVDPTAGFSLRAKISHPKIQSTIPGSGGKPGQAFSPHIERSMVVGETLWTLSREGMKASTMAEGKDLQWLLFESQK